MIRKEIHTIMIINISEPAKTNLNLMFDNYNLKEKTLEFISKELAHDMDLYFMWLWMSLLKMMRFSPQMIIM